MTIVGLYLHDMVQSPSIGSTRETGNLCRYIFNIRLTNSFKFAIYQNVYSPNFGVLFFCIMRQLYEKRF